MLLSAGGSRFRLRPNQLPQHLPKVLQSRCSQKFALIGWIVPLVTKRWKRLLEDTQLKMTGLQTHTILSFSHQQSGYLRINFSNKAHFSQHIIAIFRDAIQTYWGYNSCSQSPCVLAPKPTIPIMELIYVWPFWQIFHASIPRVHLPLQY